MSAEKDVVALATEIVHAHIREHVDPMRKRIAELEALNEASARAVEEIGNIQIDAMSPDAWRVAWRALADGQRLELMALCCHNCGSLDPRCRCGDDS